MKHLMGVVLAGHSKDYAIPKFLEMYEACVYPDKDIDFVWIVDDPRHDVPGVHVLESRMLGSMWATEIVFHGKERLRKYAIECDYDSVIWQGIDCYYESPESFAQLKATFEENGGMVGGLVAGRNRPDYPVCRDFCFDKDESGKLYWNTKQKEIAVEYLAQQIRDEQPFSVWGYPGSDATFVSRDLLEKVSMDDYEHWHTRPNKDQPLGELGPEEWFTYVMVSELQQFPLVESRCRPWHLHENLQASRYPGQLVSDSYLSWHHTPPASDQERA